MTRDQLGMIIDLKDNGWDTFEEDMEGTNFNELPIGGPILMRKVGRVIRVNPDASIDKLLQYDDIQVGRLYEINYIDTNYPCRCPCHTNHSVMHCAPCCYDNSYHGPAKCYAKRYEHKLIDFQDPRNPIHHFVISAGSVVRELQND